MLAAPAGIITVRAFSPWDAVHGRKAPHFRRKAANMLRDSRRTRQWDSAVAAVHRTRWRWMARG